MFKIRRLPVGQLQTNCYLVIESSECIIIDPGDDADYIMRVVADEQVTPSKIIATHGHFDHILAATELKLSYNIPFLMHKEDEFLLDRMMSSAKHFSGIRGVLTPEVDDHLNDKQQLVIGHLKFDILHTPGHTPGSVCLFANEQKMLFCGDLIFEQGGIGRTDFKYSDKSLLSSSIKRIINLDDDIKIYPGHGVDFILGEHRKFFTKWDKI